MARRREGALLFSSGALDVFFCLRSEGKEIVAPILSVLLAEVSVLRHRGTAVLQTNHAFADTTLPLIPSVPRWGSRVTEMQSGLSKVTRKEMARRGKELRFI